MALDKIISNALQFWYTPDHPLYSDPLPALLGLTGESGELCDLWKKKLYKPGYVFDRDAFIDELGDCLFYAAILCHHYNYSIIEVGECTTFLGDTLNAIIVLNDAASSMLMMHIETNKVLTFHIHRMVAAISAILHYEFSEMTLEELSQMNYAKLNERAQNGTGYNRGEEREYICNRADDCGVECPHKVLHNSDDFDDCFDPGCILSGLSDAVCVPVKFFE